MGLKKLFVSAIEYEEDSRYKIPTANPNLFPLEVMTRFSSRLAQVRTTHIRP